MHCSPPDHNFGWAMAHPAHPAAPPMQRPRIPYYKFFLVCTDCLAPPTLPTITGYETGRQLTEGEQLELTCTASVPDGSLRWYTDGQLLRSTCNTTTTSAGVGIRDVLTACRLTVVTRADHNGAVFACTASYNVSVVKTSSTRLTVLCE